MEKLEVGSVAWLDWVFEYQAPEPEQIVKYKNIRQAARFLAEVISMAAPACADRTVALRKVREAVMNANAAIALKGLA